MAASDWSERTRTLITVAVVAAVNLLLAVGVYLTYSEKSAQEEIHKKKVAERERLKAEVKEEEKIANDLKLLEDEIKATTEKLPEKEDIAQLITKINEVATSKSCVLVSEVKQQQPGGAGATLGLNVSQEVWKTKWKATFMNFCSLVNAIEEHFGRFIAFENLIVQPVNNGMVAMGSKEAQEDYSVDLVTYRYTGQ